MRRTAHVPAIALATLLLAACATSLGSPDGRATAPTRSVPPLATVPASDAPVIGEVPAGILAGVLADAAERAGAAEDDIEIVEAVAMTWSDGSLGCPEPGMLYTQALVDGYQVILDAGGEELDYRITADGGFRLCEDGRTPSGG
jgi:hypothetical protein